MKLQFKIQQFQTEAANAVIDVFKGQECRGVSRYIRDLGTDIKENVSMQANLFGTNLPLKTSDEDMIGFANADLTINKSTLLENIRAVQYQNNLQLSEIIEGHLGACTLDIEMETGTGKTYVYTKTMYELNKQYGWNKFIIVVPSIPIREGVCKSLHVTEEHFMHQYGKKIKFFVYNSANLPEIDDFSASSGISAMIINIQAFYKDFDVDEHKIKKDTKKKGKNDLPPIINRKLDSFHSRKPIDVIAANKPILILDEPQKMTGSGTQKGLEKFNPLFCLNYSATHKQFHNCVYALDSVDAYQQRLVKRIHLRSVEVKNLPGLNKYMYLEDFVLSPNKPPCAKLEIEVQHAGGIKREKKTVGVRSDLYALSNQLQEYRGFVVSDIDAYYGTVSFTNGQNIAQGDLTGDIAENDMRRIQIRETIRAHIEKEKGLFHRGIKVLSLFFIDEVAKYRVYDEEGNEGIGEYGKIFEEEYLKVLNENTADFLDDPYQKYLHGIDVHDTHTGYFSIDKKGRMVNSNIKRGSDESDDISAYDLILKNKELLLSFDNPVRFIFSHSALREGWDNPNVFQLCTLKPGTDNEVRTRQEVGRGLRLCVDKDGIRMDVERCGETVHDINALTVISTGSYEKIVKSLQDGIRDALHDRPQKADAAYFSGKYIFNNDGERVQISDQQARAIDRYLIKNDYSDDEGRLTDKFTEAQKNGTLAQLPDTLKSISNGVQKLIDSVFNPTVLDDMVVADNKGVVKENPLNDNFSKTEFQKLWKQINKKYAYTVNFDSEELIKNSVSAINNQLHVAKLKYTVVDVAQNADMSQSEAKSGSVFTTGSMRTAQAEITEENQLKYDLVGEIAKKTQLTRKTIATILSKLPNDKFYMFNHNPQEFISKVSLYINEQKAAIIVEHIQYNPTDQEPFDSEIFTQEKHVWNPKKVHLAAKGIQPYVFTDGASEENNELRFAAQLDTADEVCVYAKLPRGFHIPTPMGNYSPDWAIAFKEGSVKHIYFVAETKGSLSSLQLKPIENAKISCAKKLFNEISTDKVRYGVVTDYQTLYDIVTSE